ncbi:aromatic acid exporter family protein [Acholeplasma hippikon]|uniref:Predicted membrane protein n=1 Tax=Acholeplasma hippikon TaxID=264636 RepID=A0A449BKB4_9MOLU|nr:aromatic acid exporter family protein [Acholeplasma hippikon]VEU82870.1 Predicted membrane protein [Acholeplasma hippikon]
MIKPVIHTTIKLVIVGVISGLIAYLLGIENFILVGVIGILSVSITKKDSLVNGLKRYIDVLFALTLSTILYLLFGFELHILVLFIALFVFGSYATKIDVGLVPSIVLANHVYAYQGFDWPFFIDEVLIITIGTGVALLVSMLYPQDWNKKIKEQILDVDQKIKDYLFMLSILLNQKEGKEVFFEHHILLNQEITKKINDAEIVDKNIIFQNDHRYLAYLYMRRNQVNYINNMYKSAAKIKFYHEYQKIIAKYIEELIQDIGDENKANYQLEKLKNLRDKFSKEELPKTRTEFETRAMLFHIIEDLDSMLNAKKLFHERYPDFEI